MSRVPAALLLLAAAGCGSKGAVAVTAGVEGPALSVSASLLARVLSGGFTLHLELGQVAPTSTEVSLQKAGLVRVSDQSSLVAALLMTAAPPPPYHLDPGAKLDAMLTVSDGSNLGGQLISQPEFDAICLARTVQIAATVSDSASGKPTPVGSPTFDVTGCP